MRLPRIGDIKRAKTEPVHGSPRIAEPKPPSNARDRISGTGIEEPRDCQQTWNWRTRCQELSQQNLRQDWRKQSGRTGTVVLGSEAGGEAAHMKDGIGMKRARVSRVAAGPFCLHAVAIAALIASG